MNLRRLSSICCVWALCVGGCLGRGEIIPIRYYGVDSLSAPVPPATHTWQVALGVRPFTAATRYRDRILYRTSAVEFAFYPYDRWVEPPEEMVTRLVSHMVRASGLFPQVVPADNAQLPAWILSGEVTRFDEVREAGGRRAECWLQVEVRRGRDDQLLWSEVMSAVEPLTDETPEALARAMSRAVQRIAQTLITALEKAPLSSLE
jgi:ABC-type uncharacterized transport system auxiliary subunit